jgi:hypothetical protein
MVTYPGFSSGAFRNENNRPSSLPSLTLVQTTAPRCLKSSPCVFGGFSIQLWSFDTRNASSEPRQPTLVYKHALIHTVWEV